MEHFSDLAIILKTFPYQDKDRVAVMFTQNHGKVTGLAKGAVSSKRYGGSLGFLACSKISFVQKPHSEMARINEAVVHHEFRGLNGNFELLSIASFFAELCLRVIEPGQPQKEVFSCLSHALFGLDQKTWSPLFVVNAFLCKFFHHMGYPPSLLRCVGCARPASECAAFFWKSDAGGIACENCTSGKNQELHESVLFLFQKLTTTPFRSLTSNLGEPDQKLYSVLTDFLHHHLPISGLNTWKLLNQSLS